MSGMAKVDFRDFARRVGTVVHYRVGNTIFCEGDAAGLMYVILSGSVDLTKQRRVIETIQAGNAFGFVSFLDGEPRGLGANAADDCDLALIDRKKFRYMIEEMPNFVWYVLDQMAHHLRTASAVM